LPKRIFQPLQALKYVIGRRCSYFTAQGCWHWPSPRREEPPELPSNSAHSTATLSRGSDHPKSPSRRGQALPLPHSPSSWATRIRTPRFIEGEVFIHLTFDSSTPETVLASTVGTGDCCRKRQEWVTRKQWSLATRRTRRGPRVTQMNLENQSGIVPIHISPVRDALRLTQA